MGPPTDQRRAISAATARASGATASLAKTSFPPRPDIHSVNRGTPLPAKTSGAAGNIAATASGLRAAGSSNAVASDEKSCT